MVNPATLDSLDPTLRLQLVQLIEFVVDGSAKGFPVDVGAVITSKGWDQQGVTAQLAWQAFQARWEDQKRPVQNQVKSRGQDPVDAKTDEKSGVNGGEKDDGNVERDQAFGIDLRATASAEAGPSRSGSGGCDNDVRSATAGSSLLAASSSAALKADDHPLDASRDSSPLSAVPSDSPDPPQPTSPLPTTLSLPPSTPLAKPHKNPNTPQPAQSPSAASPWISPRAARNPEPGYYKGLHRGWYALQEEHGRETEGNGEAAEGKLGSLQVSRVGGWGFTRTETESGKKHKIATTSKATSFGTLTLDESSLSRKHLRSLIPPGNWPLSQCIALVNVIHNTRLQGDWPIILQNLMSLGGSPKHQIHCMDMWGKVIHRRWQMYMKNQKEGGKTSTELLSLLTVMWEPELERWTVGEKRMLWSEVVQAKAKYVDWKGVEREVNEVALRKGKGVIRTAEQCKRYWNDCARFAYLTPSQLALQRITAPEKMFPVKKRPERKIELSAAIAKFGTVKQSIRHHLPQVKPGQAAMKKSGVDGGKGKSAAATQVWRMECVMVPRASGWMKQLGEVDVVKALDGGGKRKRDAEGTGHEDAGEGQDTQGGRSKRRRLNVNYSEVPVNAKGRGGPGEAEPAPYKFKKEAPWPLEHYLGMVKEICENHKPSKEGWKRIIAISQKICPVYRVKPAKTIEYALGYEYRRIVRDAERGVLTTIGNLNYVSPTHDGVYTWSQRERRILIQEGIKAVIESVDWEAIAAKLEWHTVDEFRAAWDDVLACEYHTGEEIKLDPTPKKKVRRYDYESEEEEGKEEEADVEEERRQEGPVHREDMEDVKPKVEEAEEEERQESPERACDLFEQLKEELRRGYAEMAATA